MNKPILHKTSFGLLRTNPKLTTNVKLIADSKDGLFLESFDANDELSKSKYKGYKVINADLHDLRFLDIKNTIAGLVAKGKARKDYSGFVLDN